MIKLRRSTGYSFVKCRQALVKFGEDNIKEAEKWLKIQAKKEGWAKAERLLVHLSLLRRWLNAIWLQS